MNLFELAEEPQWLLLVEGDEFVQVPIYLLCVKGLVSALFVLSYHGREEKRGRDVGWWSLQPTMPTQTWMGQEKG